MNMDISWGNLSYSHKDTKKASAPLSLTENIIMLKISYHLHLHLCKAIWLIFISEMIDKIQKEVDWVWLAYIRKTMKPGLLSVLTFFYI